ncbi:uncharacterized protein LOC143164442 isoform X3 [Aptenodytes patagonicus]|uniref:uncharacterized protein LOC143164442 isoform X3 n=1 Tax=Aptenodytes patagonicus TaxID=9234 RepID=UPI003FA0B26C
MKLPGQRGAPAPGTPKAGQGVAMRHGGLRELQTPSHPSGVHILSRPGIVETGSVTDLLEELSSRRASTAPAMWFEQRSVVVQLIGNFCAQTRRMLWIELICEVLESHRGCTELISKSVISAAAVSNTADRGGVLPPQTSTRSDRDHVRAAHCTALTWQLNAAYGVRGVPT